MSRIQPTTDKAFRNYVQGLEDSVLFESDEQLVQLVAQPGWNVVMSMLGAGRENLIQGLLRESRVLEHTEYANRCGYIAGLEEAANAVDAVHKEAERRRTKLTEQAEAERQVREEGE